MRKIPDWLRLLPKHLKPTLEEFAYFCVFGLMPVWLGIVFRLISKQSIAEYLNNYLYSGEALLICATIIGPMIYLIQRTYGSNSESFGKPFPYKSLFFILILVVCIVSAAITGFRQGNVRTDTLTNGAVWYISFVVTITSSVVWFGVTAIKSMVDNLAPQIMRSETDEFVGRYNQDETR